jgi:hypothetical protein
LAKRTTHRSSKGKKLYAVRDKSGKFKDIQTYEKAHRADLAQASKGERKSKKKAKRKAKKKTARKKTARRKTARKKTARRKTRRK